MDSPSVVRLPDIDPDNELRPGAAGPDHRMRRVTRDVAFDADGGGWSRERAAKIADLFDSLAPEWHAKNGLERVRPVADALARNDVNHGRCIEVGSGTGIGTAPLAGHFDTVIALDIAARMLRVASAALGPRVQADASQLPFRDGSADAIALVNALLFPSEVDRVLAPDGVVVWVNTSGDQTPIHLSAEDVVLALPGAWMGVASQVGRGTWCVARRASWWEGGSA